MISAQFTTLIQACDNQYKIKVSYSSLHYQEVLLAAMANELSNMLIRFSETMSSMFGAGITTTKSRRPYQRHNACARLGNVFSHDIKSCQMNGTAAVTEYTNDNLH